MVNSALTAGPEMPRGVFKRFGDNLGELQMKSFARHLMVASTAMALLTTVGFVSQPAFAKKEEASAPKIKLSKPTQAALANVQKLQQAGDLDGAVAALETARAGATTPDDLYMVNAVGINIALARKDNVLLEKSVEGALATGKVSAADAPKFYQNLGALAAQRNDYVKAAEAFGQVAILNPADDSAYVNSAELYFRAKNPSMAVSQLNKGIAAKNAAGAKAPELWHRRLLAIAYDAKMQNEMGAAGISLVTNYPSPTNWRDALVIFRDSGKGEDQVTLDIFRLMFATDALAGEKDYFEYAETANTRGYPGEAKRALDAGLAKGVLSTTKPYVRELTGVVNGRLARDKAGLAPLEREARANATGKLAAGTATAYMGYADYAKATSLYQLALTKGGVDTAEVNTRLGFAKAQAGDKAGAEAAFKAVTGGRRQQLAQYYLAWLVNRP